MDINECFFDPELIIKEIQETEDRRQETGDRMKNSEPIWKKDY
jgi:molybdopterin synthase catalytic subunit